MQELILYSACGINNIFFLCGFQMEPAKQGAVGVFLHNDGKRGGFFG
jgi:hypothetical protein